MRLSRKLILKKYAFALFLTTLLIPLFSGWLGQSTGFYNLAPYFASVYFFILVPVFDFMLGQDPMNVPEELTKKFSEDAFYRYLTLACLPLMLLVLIYGANQFISSELTLIGKIGWIINIGIIGGVISINVAHELIHKNSKFEQYSGGLLLSLVCYGGFKIEHVRGHHVDVSTPKDASSAQYNQSLYHFLPRAYFHNITNAWKLEAKRLKRESKPVWSLSNELFIWYGFSLLWAVLAFIGWGWQGVIFFLGQSFIAFTLLEIINYIEHYGLRRKQKDNGRFERVTHHHSWNSNYFLTNILLLHLQRHSDHHAYPRRRYQVLRHFDDSPQLPAGYASMVLLALVPALWKKIINPIIDEYYSAGEN